MPTDPVIWLTQQKNKLPHEALTIKLVDSILQQAISKQASDIHLEPGEHHCRIRLRLDGLLHESLHLPYQQWPSLSSRLKILANLNIAEKRLPQDGRFSTTIGQQTYDCRLSACPTIFGEKFVIRILDTRGQTVMTLPELGLDPNELVNFMQHLALPNGMILITGPTGSGKTVTLYSILRHLNQTTSNISTIEDPVEIHLPGINQVEINLKIGLDFPRVLKALLRQDPDIIMIGEIRDLDTAKIAVNAAQTGHLVLSTLHTNSAAASLIRMLNLGVLPVNLSSALRLIVAQRLVRKLCDHCKAPQLLTNDTSKIYGLTPADTVYTAIGCEYCHQGYRGRTAVFEVLVVNEPINQLIMQAANTTTIEH